MLIPDMPNVPPQDVPVMFAQANQAQAGDMATTRTMGVCSLIPNGKSAPSSPSPASENALSPIVEARVYFNLYEHQIYEQQKIAANTATVVIMQQPRHGVLADSGDGNYLYLPEKGYLGKDSATVLVDISGVKVKVVYFFETIDSGSVGEGLVDTLCKQGYHWKISSAIDANGNTTITSVEYHAPTIGLTLHSRGTR